MKTPELQTFRLVCSSLARKIVLTITLCHRTIPADNKVFIANFCCKVGGKLFTHSYYQSEAAKYAWNDECNVGCIGAEYLYVTCCQCCR